MGRKKQITNPAHPNKLNDTYTVCQIRHSMAMSCHNCMYYEEVCDRQDDFFFDTTYKTIYKEVLNNESKQGSNKRKKGP